MTLSQWLTYLESLHPNEIELGLDRIREVADNLALDFSQQKIVIVGGTNGKGSTVSLLGSILSAAGYNVGSYTSPHLLTYNERICVNQEMVSDESLCQAFVRVEQARNEVQLTYFEFGTLAALVLFVEQKLDYILLEVGLGGRLDAVNILDADLSILTNVALDHTDWLGETREQIGTEKAGIYRAGQPALFGERNAPLSVLRHVEEIAANLYMNGREYKWQLATDQSCWQWQGVDKKGAEIVLDKLPLKDFSLNYALDNAALVLQAIALLDSNVTAEHIVEGLQNVKLTGRFQLVDRGHTLVLDVAHNPHAAENLLKNLQASFPQRKINIVIAMLEDKDMATVLNWLRPIANKWYIGEIKEDRGSPAKILYNLLQQQHEPELNSFDSIEAAFNAAEKGSGKDDIILVTGSFYTVSTVLELI